MPVSQTTTILHTKHFISEDRIPNMWNKRARILSILLLCSIAVDKSEAANAAAASASAAAAAGCLDHEPVQQNPVVDSLAELISDGLLHSEVFGDFANFEVYKP